MTCIALAYAGDFSPDEGIAKTLRERHPDLVLLEREGGSAQGLEEATAIIGFPSREQLAAMPGLSWIQLASAGADGWYLRRDVPEHVAITTASGVFGISGAEHALALLLALTRRIPDHVRQQTVQRWSKSRGATDLHGRTVVVIGMGDIGRAAAERCHAFGMKVIGVRRSAANKPPYLSALHRIADLDSVLPLADVVLLALPETPETRGLLSRERLEALPLGARVINVGRGSCLDQEALVDALRSGRVAGAGLDVTTPEPLPAEHPLWRFDNVIITSHSVNDSDGKARRRVAVIANNVERFVRRQPLLNVVDRRRGY